MGIRELIIQMEREEGEELGELRSKTTVVKNMLLETDLDIQKIAKVAEVTIDFVIEIRNTLSDR